MVICIIYQLLNKANCSPKPTFSLEITTLFLLNLLLNRLRFLKKIINISGLRFRYQRLANRKKLISPIRIPSKLWRTWSLALATHNFLSHLQIFKVGEIMVLKYDHLMLPSGAFPDKVTINIDFLDGAVAQCDIPVVKILL